MGVDFYERRQMQPTLPFSSATESQNWRAIVLRMERFTNTEVWKEFCAKWEARASTIR